MIVPVPALCYSCGTAFQLTSVDVHPGATVRFQNCVATCPACGGLARIPDGAYGVIEQIVTLVQEHRLTRQAVEQIRDALKRASVGHEVAHADGGAATVSLALSEIPQAKQLLPAFERFVAANPGTKDLIGWLLSLLAIVLSYLAWQHPVQPSAVPPPAPRQTAAPSEDVRQPYRRAGPKALRNRPCPCGSGKKTKRCHPQHCQ